MALAYAQSGHLCLATLHANNSYHAMNRIISFYPLENRPALLPDLVGVAASAIDLAAPGARSPTAGRTPAVEVLLNTRHIAELIEKGEINEIKEAMEKSMSPGSQTFEQALFKLYRDGTITQDEALANADSATNLLLADQQHRKPDRRGQNPAAEGRRRGRRRRSLLARRQSGAPPSPSFTLDMDALMGDGATLDTCPRS